ncbi:MAG: hypothetical protein R3D97_03205 [Paracoccaceae bacterium]
MISARKLRLDLVLGAGVALLAACDSAEDKEFLAACEAKAGMSSKQCSCLNDLINDGLEDKGRAYVKAIVIGDQAKVAQIQSTFGIIEGSQILARSAWIATNAPQACNVSM